VLRLRLVRLDVGLLVKLGHGGLDAPMNPLVPRSGPIAGPGIPEVARLDR
jgi:hypothetical protein